MFSDLRVLGQITTIGLGLFDTLVVRAFMTPSIAVLLGCWFWWPQRGPASSGCFGRTACGPWFRIVLSREGNDDRELGGWPTVKVVDAARGIACRARASTGRASKPTRI